MIVQAMLVAATPLLGVALLCGVIWSCRQDSPRDAVSIGIEYVSKFLAAGGIALTAILIWLVVVTNHAAL